MVALDKLEVSSGEKEDIQSKYNDCQSVEMKNDINDRLSCNNEFTSRTVDKWGDTNENSGRGGGNVIGSEVVVLGVQSSQSTNKGHSSNPPRRNFLVQYFKKKSQSWSRDQFATILILSFVEFFAAAVISIQAPFYPDVAREKGASATEYGLVFGIFEITVFIMSPIYGAKMDVLGPRRVFNWGILTTGVCCVIFGLLDAIEGRAAFIWTCLIVRIVEAMGDAAFDTASFTIIAMEFPNSVATSFAILEIFYGLGLIIGPTLGGMLFEVGGYRLPFLAMGGFLFVAAVATYFFLPELSQKQKEQQRNNKVTGERVDSACVTPDGQIANRSSEVTNAQMPLQQPPAPVVRGGFHIFKMLKIPVIAMTAYSIVAATAGVGFISANLDYHLEPVALGAVFVMNGGVYAITAPAWGWICDHIEYPKVITFIGSAFSILGFIFIGPVPYFPIDTTLVMSCFGLALFGLGLAAVLVSAFLLLLNDAIAHGYPDDISTYGLVSGLWTSMSALGYFIGPSLGFSVDFFGFRWSSLLIIGGQLILIIMLTGYYFARGRSTSHNISHELDEAKIGAEDDAKNHNSISNTKWSANNSFKSMPCSLTTVSDDDGVNGGPEKKGGITSTHKNVNK